MSDRRRARRRAPRRGASPKLRRRRLQIIVLLVVAVMGVLGARAAFLGTVKSGELSGLAQDQQRRSADVPAPRGAILASDGSRLVQDRPAVNVVATPYLVPDPTEAAETLASILERDPDELRELMSGDGGYAVLARNVSPTAAREARDQNIPGISLEDTYERFLPRGRVGAQLVGLVDDQRGGLSGLEGRLDRFLTGTAGYRVEARDPFGRPLRRIVDREAVPGQSARLTLDAVIQDRTERVLEETRERYDAKSATAVVMRPSDGAIIAMASAPGFDPNTQRNVLGENPELEKNRPAVDTFEPGSTFKAVTIAGAIEDGLVQPSTVFNLPSTLQLYDRELGEAHPRPPVSWPVSEILAKSSNVGTVLIARRFGDKFGQEGGRERINHWIERFGFGAPTELDFPGEAPGLVLPAEDWSGTSILNIPIGQGVSVTLTQMAAAYATIANGGFRVRPHLVERIGANDVAPQRGKRVISARTANAVDDMLRGVVAPDGTGSLASVEGYTVAGKTGTANKVNPDTGQYDAALLVTSFVGYLPAERPELLIAVAVDEPAGGVFGGDVAAPAFEEIAQFSLQRLRIEP